jgi:hypothetical protein
MIGVRLKYFRKAAEQGLTRVPNNRLRCGKNPPRGCFIWLDSLLRSPPALDEIVTRFSISRRTAERMRDAIAQVFPQLEELAGERPKRWRLPNSSSSIFREPLADEPATLRGVARHLANDGLKRRAKNGVLNERHCWEQCHDQGYYSLSGARTALRSSS